MKTSFLAACLAGLPLLSPAQQDAPPVDPSAILRELDAVEKNGNEAFQANRQAAARKIQAVISSPSSARDLYEQAVQALQFEGRRDDTAAFKDWKKDRAEALRSNEMQTALLLHLNYLLLSLQRTDAPDSALEQFAKSSIAYAREMSAASELFAKQNNPPAFQTDLLGQSLKSGMIARWLNLGSLLPDEQAWELTPGNLAGIFDKNVRGILREKKSPILLETWDIQLKIEADRATGTHLQHVADQFNNVRRPQLQFERARDMVLLGMNNRAITEMLALAKAYPRHPDLPQWSAEIRALLKPDAAPDTSPQ